MKIAPLKVSDPWYGRILSDESVQMEVLRGVPIESTVEMELVELLHGGSEENYRPYLHLRGELTEAVPAVQLPYGVSELVLRQGSGINVDAFYDFNPRQLQELVIKGYFSEQFKVPDEMSGIPWGIPGAADFMVVAPEYSDQPPVVFMSVLEQNEMALDQENSGYDLAAHFPDFDHEVQAQAEAIKVADGPEYGGSGLDVFSDVVFDEHQPIRETLIPRVGAEQDGRESVPSSIFERLMLAIDARRVEEPVLDEEPAFEPEAVLPGSAEDLYNTHVSPGVDRVLAETLSEVEEPGTELVHDDDVQEASVSPSADRDSDQDRPTPRLTSDGFIDFNAVDPALEPLGVRLNQVGDLATETLRKAQIRNTSRIRSGLVEDEVADLSDEAQPGM